MNKTEPYFKRISSVLVLKATNPNTITLAEGDQSIVVNLAELREIARGYHSIKHRFNVSNGEETGQATGTGFFYLTKFVAWLRSKMQ
jgi:hypothetical protein